MSLLVSLPVPASGPLMSLPAPTRLGPAHDLECQHYHSPAPHGSHESCTLDLDPILGSAPDGDAPNPNEDPVNLLTVTVNGSGNAGPVPCRDITVNLQRVGEGLLCMCWGGAAEQADPWCCLLASCSGWQMDQLRAQGSARSTVHPLNSLVYAAVHSAWPPASGVVGKPTVHANRSTTCLQGARLDPQCVAPHISPGNNWSYCVHG